ncbi:MAG: recombinase family protein [Bacteroidales bacterium]
MNIDKHQIKVGIYSRVSKDTSDNTNQLLILREYCQKMNYEIYAEYVDVISGGSPNRPEFNRMMKDASKRKFDMLLFFALDRFTREGTRKTIQYLQLLDDYGVLYRSYSEQYIDSSGIFKDVIISLLSSLALQEKIRTAERVVAGLARARLAGRIGGRPTIEPSKIGKIREMKSNGMNITEISQKLSISRGSIYRYLLN